MRILSNFHDFYDCCTDPSDKVNVYIRKQTKYLGYHGGIKEYYRRDSGPFVDFRLIGFCGKIYPYAKFTLKAKHTLEIISEDCTYDLEELKEWCEPYTCKKKHQRFYDRGLSSVVNFWKRVNLNEPITCIQRAYKIFRELDTPIFMIYRDRYAEWYYRDGDGEHILLTDCSLREVRFAKVFRPELAQQEVEMYRFGVLGSQKREQIPAVSDRDMIEAKGFNLKTSFRKPKKEK